MSEQPKGDQNTELEELNDKGAGATLGEKSEFEPEEDEKSDEA